MGSGAGQHLGDRASDGQGLGVPAPNPLTSEQFKQAALYALAAAIVGPSEVLQFELAMAKADGLVGHDFSGLTLPESYTKGDPNSEKVFRYGQMLLAQSLPSRGEDGPAFLIGKLAIKVAQTDPDSLNSDDARETIAHGISQVLKTLQARFRWGSDESHRAQGSLHEKFEHGLGFGRRVLELEPERTASPIERSVANRLIELTTRYVNPESEPDPAGMLSVKIPGLMRWLPAQSLVIPAALGLGDQDSRKVCRVGRFILGPSVDSDKDGTIKTFEVGSEAIKILKELNPQA